MATVEDLARLWSRNGACTCEVQTVIAWRDTVKLLGLRIDAGFTFLEHYEHVVAQHSVRVSLLMRLAGTDWGCTAPLHEKYTLHSRIPVYCGGSQPGPPSSVRIRPKHWKRNDTGQRDSSLTCRRPVRRQLRSYSHALYHSRACYELQP